MSTSHFLHRWLNYPVNTPKNNRNSLLIVADPLFFYANVFALKHKTQVELVIQNLHERYSKKGGATVNRSLLGKFKMSCSKTGNRIFNNTVEK